MKNVETTRGSIFALFLIPLLAAPAVVAAQDGGEEDELTRQQRELNRESVTAIDSGDYERAIELLQDSLELGPRNVIYANLGRAFQLAGQCEEAVEQFDKVDAAPAVEQPSPEQVMQVVQGYREELMEKCPGYLEVECRPSDIALYIDDEGPGECEGRRHRLPPGDYVVRGEYEGHITETTVSVAAMDISRVRLALTEADVEESGPAQDKITTEVTSPPQPGPPTSSPTSWTWLTGSGVALAGGIAFDTIPANARNDEINAINFVPVGFYALSIGLAYIGIRNLRR